MVCFRSGLQSGPMATAWGCQCDCPLCGLAWYGDAAGQRARTGRFKDDSLDGARATAPVDSCPSSLHSREPPHSPERFAIAIRLKRPHLAVQLHEVSTQWKKGGPKLNVGLCSSCPVVSSMSECRLAKKGWHYQTQIGHDALPKRTQPRSTGSLRRDRDETAQS
jgi:hypothetical protein